VLDATVMKHIARTRQNDRRQRRFSPPGLGNCHAHGKEGAEHLLLMPGGGHGRSGEAPHSLAQHGGLESDARCPNQSERLDAAISTCALKLRLTQAAPTFCLETFRERLKVDAVLDVVQLHGSYPYALQVQLTVLCRFSCCKVQLGF